MKKEELLIKNVLSDLKKAEEMQGFEFPKEDFNNKHKFENSAFNHKLKLSLA